jgi:hypothetical protein
MIAHFALLMSQSPLYQACLFVTCLCFLNALLCAAGSRGLPAGSGVSGQSAQAAPEAPSAAPATFRRSSIVSLIFAVGLAVVLQS